MRSTNPWLDISPSAIPLVIRDLNSPLFDPPTPPPYNPSSSC